MNIKRKLTKKTFWFLLLSLLMISCNHDNRLQGIWIVAYNQIDNESPLPFIQKTIFDFNDNKLKIVSLDELSNTNFGNINIEEVKYTLDKSKSSLFIGEIEYKVKINNDSIILIKKENASQKTVLKRLIEKNQQYKLSNDYFKGSFIVSGEKYIDSIDLINDSTLIHTGININSIADKWRIVKYKNFNFFNVYNEFSPLMLIKSYNKDSIELEFIYLKSQKITMLPTKSIYRLNDLIGNWKEFLNSDSKPPLPPGVRKGFKYYQLKFDQDSVQISSYYKVEKMKWSMSNDGKLIYFYDRLNNNCNSLKILSINDNILTLKFCTDSGLEERIMQFIREIY